MSVTADRTAPTVASAPPAAPAGRAEALRAIEQEVGVLLRRVRRVIGERARAVHPTLQPGSYVVLDHVAQHGPLRASSLSQLFDLDKGAVSRQVQHLIDLDLLDRAPDPADGRATLLSASDTGRRRLQEVAEERSAYFDGRLGGWDDAELVDLAVGLRRYNAALGD